MGYIGAKADLSLAKRLLIESQSRGKDATGYLEIADDGRYVMRKRAVPAKDFVKDMKFQFRGAPHTFLGHTRLATTDAPDDPMQAHPFVGERYIVFHNGVIQDFDQKLLCKRFGIAAPNGVDSELFLAFLEQKGTVDALRTDFLPLLSDHSAYALVIFDKLVKSVHFLRCNGRTLALGRTKENGLFYASTEQILQAAIPKKLIFAEMLQPYTHLEIASFSGEILRKCAIESAKSLDYRDAVDYITTYRKPIRFF